MLWCARRDSLKRLVEKAAEKGANAIVGADFEKSDILRGTATLFSAYGTAVVIEPAKENGWLSTLSAHCVW